MDLWIAVAIFVAGLAASQILGMSVLWPLLLGLVAFLTVGCHRGFSPGKLLRMAWGSVRDAGVVLEVFLFIGMLTGLWRSGGTIAFFVYYGLKSVPSGLFVLCAFLLSVLVSYTLGSSFGTVGTIGVVLAMLAHAGGVPAPVAAGAILSGAYVGDRGAPTSSCAILVSALSKTELYGNVHRMMKRVLVPLAVTAVVYGVMSLRFPLAAGNSPVLDEIPKLFSLSVWTVIPAVLILVLPLFHVPIRWAMLSSVISAVPLACFVQHRSLWTVLYHAVLGFPKGEGTFSGAIGGGGIVSMLTVSAIVLLSSSYAGIFTGTRMLDDVQRLLCRLVDRLGHFATMLLPSVVINCVACSQTFGILLTKEMLGPVYTEKKYDPHTLASDLSDTVVLTAGLIPWNLACAVPLAMVSAGVSALPFACWCRCGVC